MIAAPPLRSLVRFEVVRLARSRTSVLGLAAFVLALGAVRVLTYTGHLSSVSDQFRMLYFLALVPVFRFGLLEDRAAGFDEALTANGVAPFRYVAAKLSAAALTLVAFTLACAGTSMLVGGVPLVMVGWAAAHVFLVAWLFAPGALFVESVSEIRMPMAAVYILVFVAMLLLYSSGRFADFANLTGLSGRSVEDLGRLLVTDLLVATPAILVVAWLTVARRLTPLRR